jgi:hypothetical protein
MNSSTRLLITSVLVAAFPSAGAQAGSHRSSTVLIAAPLAAPAAFTAQASGSDVGMGWRSSPGANLYQVYRSVSNGTGGWNTVRACSTASLTCSDSSAVSGIGYFYTVYALNASGVMSLSSNTVAITLTGTTTAGIGHGVGPTITTFTPSGPITATSGQTISGLSISNPNGPCITLNNVTNVKIVNNQIGPCGSGTSGAGISISGSDHVTIQNNNFNDVSSGVYAMDSTGGHLNFSHNYATKVRGPMPRGQIIQFNNVSGAGLSVTCNVSDQAIGGYKDSSGTYTGPEDHINVYMSNGTASSPIEVAYNKIRGGGSPSGGGIMSGDTGGSYQSIHDNILVNPGQYGIAIAGGNYIQMTSNRVFASANSWNNVGSFVWEQGGVSCGNTTFQSNRINYVQSGSQNNYWNGGGCGTVDTSTDVFGDTTLDASIWNLAIPQCQ